MRVSAKASFWLLPLLLMGCSHRTHNVASPLLAPPLTDTEPIADPSTTPAAPSPTVSVVAPQPGEAKAPAVTPPSEPAPAVTKKPVKHVHKEAAPPVQQAAVAQPEVSAIGQLSTGNPDGPTGEKIEASINRSEKKLNSITRSLSAPEQRTAAQIREFLKEARQALATGDTDGAGTLAEKAKVLLAELHP